MEVQFYKKLLEGYAGYVESIPKQRPERVAEAIVDLVNTPFDEKPLRTVVDFSGLKQPIENYNKVLNETAKAIYTANGVDNLLTFLLRTNKPSTFLTNPINLFSVIWAFIIVGFFIRFCNPIVIKL